MYIDTDGSLGYTVAHSAFIPPGAITSGFVFATNEFYNLAGPFVACPQTAGGDYQVFATIPGVTLSENCLGFDMRTESYSGFAAWEYT